MKKKKRLISVHNTTWGLRAAIYDKANVCYDYKLFCGYPKKEIVASLRADGVIVSKEMEKLKWGNQ